MIRVVVVEDSELQRTLIVNRLNAEPDINVVSAVGTGGDCLRVVPRLRPNVVILDGGLPDIPGPEVTSRLLELFPVPVILYTASPKRYQDLAEVSGAVATVSKQGGVEESASTLLRVLRVMNGMTVIRRIPKRTADPGARKFLLIGSSSGGPLVVEEILKSLTPNWGISVVLVQHLSEAGTSAFMNWLQSVTPWECELVSPATDFVPGKVYLGPAGSHLVFNGNKLVTEPSTKKSMFAPSVDRMFSSFARHAARQSVAVVLSGMGNDGAQGLLDLRLAGAITLVQDPTTAAVSGMPESAIAMGAALRIVGTSRIGRATAGYFPSQHP